MCDRLSPLLVSFMCAALTPCPLWKGGNDIGGVGPSRFSSRAGRLASGSSDFCIGAFNVRLVGGGGPCRGPDPDPADDSRTVAAWTAAARDASSIRFVTSAIARLATLTASASHSASVRSWFAVGGSSSWGWLGCRCIDKSLSVTNKYIIYRQLMNKWMHILSPSGEWKIKYTFIIRIMCIPYKY